ncbi:MAG: barstar family protein [Blautia sp.]|jgi:ribonuclease inhibitor
MQEICIEGSSFSTIEEIHEFLQNEMDFPEYYGGNLSALYDMLTDLCEETKVSIDLKGSTLNIREYLERMGQVLSDAQEENPYLCVQIVNE